jgi:hypothetical protein
MSLFKSTVRGTFELREAKLVLPITANMRLRGQAPSPKSFALLRTSHIRGPL